MQDSRPVVLITGAAQRLGRAMALALARAGWDIAVHYHRAHDAAQSLQQDLQALGASSVLLPADLSQASDCAQLTHACATWAGARWQALVNNASCFEPDAAVDANLDVWQTHIDTNARAPWLLAQALYQHVSDGAGTTGVVPESASVPCVLNILDQKVFNLNHDYFSYTMSKHLLGGLTRMLALSLAPRVRVCGLAPGITLPSGPQDADNFARAHRQTPLGRSSTADDIAQAVVWMLSAGAVHGSTLIVDGGQHLWPRVRDVMFEV